LLLLVSVASFFSQGQNIRIISSAEYPFGNGRTGTGGLAKLISVLTHEIMNSVTPIISLTSTIRGLVDERVTSLYSTEEIEEDENLDDIRTGLQTIEKRSTGHVAFCAELPPLNPRSATAPGTGKRRRSAETTGFIAAKRTGFPKAKLRLIPSEIPLTITADSELIEQVLLNLVKTG
jgi:two-component system nitrogen regulation sensor histidine kinase NtrY